MQTHSVTTISRAAKHERRGISDAHEEQETAHRWSVVRRRAAWSLFIHNTIANGKGNDDDDDDDCDAGGVGGCCITGGLEACG